MDKELEGIIDKDWILIKKNEDGISGGSWTSKELATAITQWMDKQGYVKKSSIKLNEAKFRKLTKHIVTQAMVAGLDTDEIIERQVQEMCLASKSSELWEIKED